MNSRTRQIIKCYEKLGFPTKYFCTFRDDTKNFVHVIFVKSNKIEEFKQKYGDKFQVIF